MIYLNKQQHFAAHYGLYHKNAIKPNCGWRTSIMKRNDLATLFICRQKSGKWKC